MVPQQISHALEFTLEICLAYAAFSFLCTGLWIALIEYRNAAKRRHQSAESQADGQSQAPDA
jgi:hypothetical protein